MRKSARAAFDETIAVLSKRAGRISDPVFATLSLAALADLAADLQDPSLEHARDVLIIAAQRLERIAARRAAVHDPIKAWRRTITLAPHDTSQQLRCFAIRDAEARMKACVEGTPITLPLSGYRSSSMSQ